MLVIVDPSSKMALEYSRDSQAPVLHALQGIFLAIQAGLFLPDVSRVRRWLWKLDGMHQSLEQA